MKRLRLKFLFTLENIINRQIDAAAIAYEGGRLHPKHRLTGYHDFFVERIKPSDTVLDVGCGIGAVAHSIAKSASCCVLGIDSNPENIKTAEALWSDPGLSFMIAKAPEGLPEKTFSVVVLSNILEHIEDRLFFLDKIRDKVNPRKILIRVPFYKRDWKVPMKKELGISYFNDPGHYVEYTEDGLREELARAGYSITEKIIRWGEIWATAIPVS
jgi:SAM-dependent methyltransferase